MEYKVITESLFNSADQYIGQSVLLVKWSTTADDVDCCLRDASVVSGDDIETSYGLVESQSIFTDLDSAENCFFNESTLIKNG